MEVGALTWLPSLMSSFSIASVRTSSSRLSGMERRKPGQTPAAKHTVSTIPRETASLPVNSTHLSVHAYTRPRLCHPRPIYTHTHTHTIATIIIIIIAYNNVVHLRVLDVQLFGIVSLNSI